MRKMKNFHVFYIKKCSFFTSISGGGGRYPGKVGVEFLIFFENFFSEIFSKIL